VTLGPGDRFSVHVYGQDNLSSEYRVNEDGTISFPYLHTVRVEDRTASDVAQLLREGLGPRTEATPNAHEVLRDPNVSVTILEVTSRRVSVFGQVQHPGVFPHQQCLTVTQVISLAGGFTQLAEKNQVRVTRRPREAASGDATVTDGGVPARPRTFVLRVEDIAEGRAPDFDLEPGDVIFVPESVT
jgi:polysaccharide export outer membrane protein